MKCRILVCILLSALLLGGACLPALADGDPYAAYPFPVNQSLQGKTVILDPGHCQGSGGAYADYVEHVHVLRIAELLKTDLENCGATVVMTRTDATKQHNLMRMCLSNSVALGMVRGVKEAAGAADDVAEIDRLLALMASIRQDESLVPTYFNSPYDYSHTRVIHPDLKKIFEYESDPVVAENLLFVSLHTNAPGSSDTSISGCITYCLNNSWSDSRNYYTAYSHVERSKRFARLMGEQVAAAADYRNRGVSVNDFFMLREHNIPAALVEAGYHTNATDRAKLMDEVYKKRIANGVAYAIVEYFTGSSAPSGGETLPEETQDDRVTSSVYRVSSQGVSGVPLGTDAAALLGNLSSQDYELRLTDAAGQPKAQGGVVTGDVLCAYAQEELKGQFPIVLYGDINGDGQIALLDLLMLQKHLLGTAALNGAYLRAADVNHDSRAALLDLLVIQKYLLGTGTITQ
ncbi:MAG: N-acetylmuramoyl-L-alanine amidase [Eubacteriales bacterium]|nr:N-acetylmuramoyl-L-alanine amidase [Eubacteriales bacterium]